MSSLNQKGLLRAEIARLRRAVELQHAALAQAKTQNEALIQLVCGIIHSMEADNFTFPAAAIAESRLHCGHQFTTEGDVDGDLTVKLRALTDEERESLKKVIEAEDAAKAAAEREANSGIILP